MKNWEKQIEKKEEAEARQDKYNGLTYKQKMALIKKRPGLSKKETARLLKREGDKNA